MHCARCGHENEEGAAACANCGTPLAPNVAQAEEAKPKERKVIKLASDLDEQPSTPNERPWEVRVPKRAASPSDSGKMSRARKGAGATGSIPAIKRPASAEATEKIPVIDSQTGKGKAVVGASVGGAAADAVIAANGASAADAKQAPTPRRATRDSSLYVGKKGGGSGKGGKKALIVIAAVLLCIVIAIIFGFATGSKASYVVSFDTNGGSAVAEQTVTDGSLERPGNPTREGYVFTGWFTDKDLSDPARFPMEVTGDVTLYARWTALNPAAEGSSASNAAGAQGAIAAATGGGSSASGGSSSGGAATKPGSSGSSVGSSGGSATKPGTSGSGSGSSGGSGSGVTLTAIASNGRTLSGTVHLKNGYVIPNSSEKAYTVAEIRALGLNQAELCIARNEIFARLGYDFGNPGLQKYFDARSWYHNSGKKPGLVTNSPGWVTANSILAVEKEISSPWINLRLK